MPSAYATKLAEGFSSKVMQEVYLNAIFDEICNRDYEGDINDVGSKLNILSFAKLSEKVYNGNNLSVDDLSEVNGQLVIDQQKSFYWREKTLAKWQSYIKEPRPVIIKQTASERRKNVDKFILGFFNRVAAGNRVGTDYTTGTVSIDASGNVTGSGTTFTSSMVGKAFTCTGLSKQYRIATFTSTTAIAIQLDVFDDTVTAYDGGVIAGGTSYTIQANTPVALIGSNIMSNLLSLKQKLDDQEVPDEDRYLVVPPIIAKLIPQGTNISLSVPAAFDALVKKGFLTELVGFKIIQTPRVAGDNVNGWHVLACNRNWLTFADKVLQVGMEEDLIGNFGTAYKDLYVYGAHVTDNRLKFAAELFCTG
jgi:hypothetical protein